MLTEAAGLRRYLGDALDADAIVLEVGGLPSFEHLKTEVCTTQALYDLVRDVWDAAYSHGMHDALAGEGLSLVDIVESGE